MSEIVYSVSGGMLQDDPDHAVRLALRHLPQEYWPETVHVEAYEESDDQSDAEPGEVLYERCEDEDLWVDVEDWLTRRDL